MKRSSLYALLVILPLLIAWPVGQIPCHYGLIESSVIILALYVYLRIFLTLYQRAYVRESHRPVDDESFQIYGSLGAGIIMLLLLVIPLLKNIARIYPWHQSEYSDQLNIVYVTAYFGLLCLVNGLVLLDIKRHGMPPEVETSRMEFAVPPPAPSSAGEVAGTPIPLEAVPVPPVEGGGR